VLLWSVPFQSASSAAFSVSRNNDTRVGNHKPRSWARAAKKTCVTPRIAYRKWNRGQTKGERGDKARAVLEIIVISLVVIGALTLVLSLGTGSAIGCRLMRGAGTASPHLAPTEPENDCGHLEVNARLAFKNRSSTRPPLSVSQLSRAGQWQQRFS
jgi:hypothetical protein